MAKEYSVVTKLKANIDNYKKNMQAAQDKAKSVSDKIQKNMNKIGGGMKTAGAGMTKYVTAPLAAVGGIAFAAANDIDKAYKEIRTGTGKTGEELEGLKDSFDNVFKNVPNSAGEVSNSLATLNTLTGATDSNLQTLSQSVLEASNSLGEDGVANSEAFGKAMGQWQIPAKDGVGELDKLFKLTQDYGVGLGEISGHLSTYGSVLKNAGFEMDESATLMASLEASGLNVSRVMPGLNAAFRNWSKEGKNSREEFDKTITKMQDAESETEALSIATEQFGAEGAQRLTTAIRNGTIPALDDLSSVTEGSKGSISENTKATETFGDKLAKLKNKAQVGLQPLGEKLLVLAEEWIPKVVSAVDRVSTWFTNLSPTMQKVIPIIGLIVMAIPPLIMVIGSIISGISAMIPLFVAAGAAIAAISAPVWIAIGVITALIAIGVAVWKNWSTVKTKAIEIWGAISEFLSNTIQGIKDIFNNVLNWIDDKTNGKFKIITDTIRNYMEMAWDIFSSIWGYIKKSFTNAIDFIKALVSGDFEGMKNAIKSQMENIRNLISNILRSIKKFFVDTVSNIVNSAQNKFRNFQDNVSKIFNKVKNFITDPIEKAKDKVGKTEGKITGFFKNIGDKLKIKIPKPKLPKFKIKGSFSLKPPSVPRLGISWNAKGGIFNKPTLFNTKNAGLQGVGEAGSEAIIPLKDSVLGKIGSMISKTMQNDNLASNISQIFNTDRLVSAMETGVSNGIKSSVTVPETTNNQTSTDRSIHFNIENLHGTTKKDAENFGDYAMKYLKRQGLN